MENRIHKAEMPMDEPRIFGPMKLPSTCWMTRISTPKMTAWIGSTNSRMKMLGIAPMKGPNTGIIFVMPINTLISSAKSSRRIAIATNVITPMMAESMILPTKKPVKFTLA